MSAPVIETSRLRLRGHVMSDMEAFWNFFQSPRSAHVDAPKNRTHLYYGFTSEVGTWDLLGHGGWAIETKDGDLAGQVSITFPPHFPEREIGWILFEGFEGQGLAFEACSAALNWAWTSRDWDSLVSYIDRKNARSIALAERLGAVMDPNAETYDDVDVVYRHAPDADGSVEAYA